MINNTAQNEHVPGFSMTLTEIAAVLSTEYAGTPLRVTGVSIDTRTIKAGNIYFALKGENFDGHDFIVDAFNKGAVACVVQKSCDSTMALRVDDTRLALASLAHAWRKRFAIPFIAITGSNGKTTVKEMIAAILSENGLVMATQGNLNNDIGVPLTLFRLDDTYQYAVIEMGANHPGEIAYLVNIAQPSVAVLNNAGAAHLEGFGSLEGVAHAKAEIFNKLDKDGCAIVNADDQFYPTWLEMTRHTRVTSFALNNRADVTATWKASGNGNLIELSTPEGNTQVKLNLLGEHNVMNALAAVAATLAVGISLQQIKSGLEKMLPVKGRLQIKNGINDCRVIDDTYNANPSSLRVALKVLQGFSGKHLLALGDMGELGHDAVELHREAGLDAKQFNVDQLYAVGQLASHAVEAFGEDASAFADKNTLVQAIKNQLNRDVTVLVKGSRRMKMEDVVDSLTLSSGG